MAPRTADWVHGPFTATAPVEAPAASSVAPAESALELCGVGVVPGTSAAAPDRLPPHLGEYAYRAAMERTRAALDAGGVRERVALRVLLAVSAQGDERTRWVREAATLSQGGGDPVAAAWAAGVCSTFVPGCAPAAARAWTDIEPANAAAWVAAFSAGAIAWSELERALARAGDYSNHSGQLPATVAAAVPPDLPDYVRAALVVQASASEATALVLPSLAAQHCRTAAAQGCSALARLMVERGDTLLARRVGERIGQASGWPADEFAALRAESDAWQRLPTLPPGAEQPHGCTHAQGWLDHAARVARFGEIHVMRERHAAAAAATIANTSKTRQAVPGETR